MTDRFYKVTIFHEVNFPAQHVKAENAEDAIRRALPPADEAIYPTKYLVEETDAPRGRVKAGRPRLLFDSKHVEEAGGWQSPDDLFHRAPTEPEGEVA